MDGKDQCWVIDILDPWPFKSQGDSRLSAYFSELGVLDYDDIEQQQATATIKEMLVG